MLLRFDDTNPSKEKAEFQASIIEDLRSLEIEYHEPYSHTSDHFEIILEHAVRLIRSGDAFVDDTEGKQMQTERKACIESKNRYNSIDTNIALWHEMVNGTSKGFECCLRIKMDMLSENGCMRDPVIYRCKEEPHHRTGTRYKVYPTYDFACPVVDSIEGVTHAMRTSEYRDRNEQYYRIIDILGLRKPVIQDYSRLNFVYTLLSKRKLAFFVDHGVVNGWDDPRMPTVRGMLRRGLEVAAIRSFVMEQGASNQDNLMFWDKIWSLNCKVLDPIAHRYTVIVKQNAVHVTVNALDYSEIRTIPLLPKIPDGATKSVLWSSSFLLEQADVNDVKVGEEVTLVNVGNVIIADKSLSGSYVGSMKVDLNLHGSVKGTRCKFSWIGVDAQNDEFTPIAVVLVELSYLISVPKLEEDMIFENVVREHGETWKETLAYGEPALRHVRRGQTVQLIRKGFYRCDREYVSNDEPLVLFAIPDGKQ